MRKLFIGALAFAGASLIFAIVAPGAYNDVVNGIAWLLDWVRNEGR